MNYPKLTIKKTENDPTEIDERRLVEVKEKRTGGFLVNDSIDAIVPRGPTSLDLEDKAFYLSTRYDWVLGKDDANCTVLIPLKK